jgi:hypothetical protein
MTKLKMLFRMSSTEGLDWCVQDCIIVVHIFLYEYLL